MAGGHPSTPRSRDFMSRSGTPAKRTFSVNVNDRIRWTFVRFMSGEKLSKIMFIPRFDEVLNSENFDSKSCQAIAFALFSSRLHFATWRYLFALILT
jgi:hypothetical protein